jgi:branched-chain amino acid transport system permease protein
MSRRVALILVVLAAIAVAPPLLSSFWVFILIQVMVSALYATSFNFLLSQGGMLVFGYATFYGLGAYAVAILNLKLGLGLLPAILLAPFVAAAFGALIAYFCIRVSGIYFSMLTFAFQMLAYAIFLKSYDFAGGDDGLHGLVIPGVLGTPIGLYYLTFCVVLVCLVLIRRIGRSPFGMALDAQRSNERKSLATGIDVKRQKFLAFVIATFFAGIAGVLAALASQSVFPDWLDWRASAVPIIMTILGGMHNFAGPLIGAALYVLLQTVMTGYTEYWALFMGVLILVIVMLLPNGVVNLFGRRHG